MTTWNEIRDEIAGMLADGKPLEDVIAKLEKRKNEMAKPITEQEYLQTCDTEQLAEFLACVEARQNADYNEETKAWVEWLKQPHTFE